MASVQVHRNTGKKEEGEGGGASHLKPMELHKALSKRTGLFLLTINKWSPFVYSL